MAADLLSLVNVDRTTVKLSVVFRQEIEWARDHGTLDNEFWK